MNQTRTFLLIAWMVVAYLLWDAWQKDYLQPPVERATAEQAEDSRDEPLDDGVPDASLIPSGVDPATVPQVALPDPTTAPASATPILLSNDVVQISLDPRGGTVLSVRLREYSETADEDSDVVQLLSQRPDHFFVAQAGWVSSTGNAPSHQAEFRPERDAEQISADADTVNFVWTDAEGLQVRRSYRLEPGSYLIEVSDEISNDGSATWRGNAYRQLLRVPPPSKGGGITNPESYSFVGAAWYSPQDKFEKLKFDNYESDEPLALTVTGGWVAMLQHYFVAAWIPDAAEVSAFSTAESRGRYLIRTLGPVVEVAPGARQTSTARLYVGPKLQDRLEVVAPGLGLTLDYGIFTVISQPLHWLLAKLHALTGNWGWAIVLLVVLIKLALFKLSEAQYKSFAKMRRVQPRIEALKERYGDDRQKFQQAMMELYKKEKINPVGGCLPVLLQFPIFIALYWVLLESVELRHAPWILWIDNLTAPDPYFVLPVINLVSMWLTQKLSPTPGMDPMQKKMMQAMPLVFGVMFAFFPAGLVLYWATNGTLGLLQQWIITRRHGEPAKA